jgi:hypothetical protein
MVVLVTQQQHLLAAAAKHKVQQVAAGIVRVQ